MYNEKLPINRFSGNFSSYMHTILFLSMNFVYKACNPAILNLSINQKTISLGLLDYRPKSFIYVILGFVICMCIFLLLVRFSQSRSGHVGGKWLYRYYDLYRRLRLQFLVLLMMGAVTPETCRVILQ